MIEELKQSINSISPTKLLKLQTPLVRLQDQQQPSQPQNQPLLVKPQPKLVKLCRQIQNLELFHSAP